MSTDCYLDKMKTIQSSILCFIDQENSEENLQNLFDLLCEYNIHDNIYEFKSFIHLIIKIANNHHRNFDFFEKIDKLILLIKDDIMKYFDNYAIFHLFKSNKRILLLLFEEQTIFVDNIIFPILISPKFVSKSYHRYFSPEIKMFLSGININYKKIDYDIKNEIEKEIPEDFEEKRRKGENDTKICEIIREDSIEEFIEYFEQNKFHIFDTIQSSIFETNSFLLNKETTLIEYAAFFSSEKILKFLISEYNSIKPSIWLYAIHGNKIETIQLLEEKKIKPENNNYNQCFKESIKCHHNEIAFYLNYLHLVEDKYDALKYYNFAYIKKDFNDKATIFALCKYDYPAIVKLLLLEINFDINIKIIQK